jgi:hypothetical protein
MKSFQIVAVAVCLFAGLVMGGIFFYQGRPIFGVMLLLAGGVAALAFVLGGWESRHHPAIQIGAAGLTALSIVGTFTYNRAFDPMLQSAQADALFEIGVLGQHCRPMTPELNRVRDFGMAACAQQASSDQLSAVGELANGMHFGPTVTLIDSAVTLGAGENPNYCAQAYAEVVRLCPASSLYIPTASRKALLNATR